jgi:hypothetical protein
LTFGFRHLAFAALRAILMRFRGGIFSFRPAAAFCESSCMSSASDVVWVAFYSILVLLLMLLWVYVPA